MEYTSAQSTGQLSLGFGVSKLAGCAWKVQHNGMGYLDSHRILRKVNDKIGGGGAKKVPGLGNFRSNLTKELSDEEEGRWGSLTRENTNEPSTHEHTPFTGTWHNTTASRPPLKRIYSSRAPFDKKT